ncbi:MAG: hypothetical protein R2788_06365 [Saprospiraceae bacterium]
MKYCVQDKTQILQSKNAEQDNYRFMQHPNCLPRTCFGVLLQGFLRGEQIDGKGLNDHSGRMKKR